MTPAAAAILEGMPDPRLLHRADGDGTTWILAGSVVLACYPSGDAGLRNVTVAVCRQLGFGGRAVAAVMGLTENYVATLHNRALREGTAGLVQAQGRPRKLAGDAWEKAARWRGGGRGRARRRRRRAPPAPVRGSARGGGSRRPAPAPGWPGSPAVCCPAGMRGRCWPTPTWTGSARRRSWRPRCRPPWPGRAMTTWRC